MTKDLVVDALDMAAWTRRHTSLKGLICHSDAGSQYTSIAYTDRLADIEAMPSIGTIGDCPFTGYSRGASEEMVSASNSR